MIDEMQELRRDQREILVELTQTTTTLKDLCKKFDDFIDNGSPRCATHNEKLKSTQKGLKVIYGWVSAITMALVYALINHLTGRNQ